MLLATVTFGSSHGKESERLEDVAGSYLGSLQRDGQVCGEYFLTWIDGGLTAHVMLSGQGATALRHHSPWGRKRLAQVVEDFGGKPVWNLLDDDARKPDSSWKGAPFLYLFTTAFGVDSPVCRGDGERPVPVFKLPMAFETKEEMYGWQGSYSSHDHVWLRSGALEIGAYRQLAEIDSELSQTGRDLCQEIEASIGVPTYYYLMRYWGRARGEENRVCPGCGGAWSMEPPAASSRQFHHFDFKCDPCRLVSHVGCSVDGGRHFRIGEFQGRKVESDLPLNRIDLNPHREL